MKSPQEQIRRRAKAQAVEVMTSTATAGTTITYSDLAQRISAQRYAPNGTAFADLLCEVSRGTQAKRGVLLSAVVVHSSDGLPGKGFFKLAEDLGRAVGDRSSFHTAALDEVHRAYASESA